MPVDFITVHFIQAPAAAVESAVATLKSIYTEKYITS